MQKNWISTEQNKKTTVVIICRTLYTTVKLMIHI